MIAQDKVQINLKGLFFALVVMLIAVFFGVGLVANGDPLWFLPFFSEKPMRIVISNKGCTVELFEGEKNFDTIYLAANSSLSQLDGVNEQFGFSPGAVEEYRNTERVLELYYGRPITVHTSYSFGHPDSLLIPLTGHFADSRAVFGGHDGDYWAGALRLKSIDAITAAANQVQCNK